VSPIAIYFNLKASFLQVGQKRASDIHKFYVLRVNRNGDTHVLKKNNIESTLIYKT
jgi:hypothetical protein